MTTPCATCQRRERLRVVYAEQDALRRRAMAAVRAGAAPDRWPAWLYGAWVAELERAAETPGA